MTYGDLHLFDILIFGGIAAFLFFRLRSVLGKRTGFEKKHNPKIINQEEEQRPSPTKISVPELDLKFKELETAYKKMKNFDHLKFLEGAKIAFERIVLLFNQGDKQKLKPLLTNKTHDIFCKAIDLKKDTSNNQVLSLKIESVEKVQIIGKKILITIAYLSSQIDPTNNQQTQKKDIWTFEKNINSDNPNWLLSST